MTLRDLPATARAAGAAVVLLLALSAQSAHAAIAPISASTGTNLLGTTLKIAEPSGVTSGDVLLATVVGSGTGAITPPSGWTQIESTVTGQHQVSYYHVTTTGEPTSWTWSLGSTRAASGGIVAYSGVNTVAPVDASAASSGSSGNIVAPSVTTNVAGDQVIAAVSSAPTLTNSVTPAPGMTKRYDVSTSGSESEAADLTDSTAGPTGTYTATQASSAAWIAQTIALGSAANATLSVATSASPSFSASLPAGDQTATYTLPLTVQDTRTGSGAASGWNLSITSTPFTSGAHALPSGASSATGVSATCTGGAVCVAPSNSVSYPLTVPAGTGPPTAAKLFNAASASGTGVFSVTPTIGVSVPGNSYTGTYTSTLTITLISGP